MEKIKLFERIKETSQVIGEANISLNGAADGFSAFGDYYNVDDIVYYAITDGARYEVGSGQYITDGSNKVITRIPFQSTNSNNKVSFPDASIKEVFATYPGKYSVFTAPELGQLSNPQHSGIAFWATENILDYDPSVAWDKTNKKLNIDGEANVSGNVTVGGNVVVSGTMDIQGDVTFIDSSNVTIWDKQLELASMSGTALFGDGNIDDAGIVVKSTDTDKKWVWKSSTDAWSTDENIITSLNVQAKSGVLDALDMNVLSSQPTHQEGVVFYDQDSHTLTLYNDESDVALQLGQEEFLRVRNKTGATITNGTAVLIDGSYGSASPSVSGAIANSESNSQVVGIATHDIENDSFGYITTYGLVRDIDTSHYSDGDEVFLSETLIGSGVSTAPIVPNYEVRVGHCVKSHLTNGSVLVQLGSVKLGGGDLKIESSVQVSGVPFVTNLASDVAAAVQTDKFFYYDSGINRLYSTSVNVSSGVILEDGVPNSTASTLYNDGGTLKFNGSQIGSWFISDGKGHNEEITLGQYVHVSGLSGVDTYYNSDTNVLEVNPAVLSGYFNGKINTLDFFTSWEIYGNAGPASLVDDQDSIGFLGDSGVETYYNSLNKQLEINTGSLSGWANGTIVGTGTTLANDIGESGMAVSGWAWNNLDKLYTSGNAISGWANGTIVGTGNALANDIGESGMSVSGWANGTIIGTGTTLANDIGQSGMAVSGWAAYDIDNLYTSGNAISGWAWGNIDKLYTSGNAISGWTRGTITQEIDSLVYGAPATLNTLGELAAAINNEYNFHTLIRNEIADSGNAVSGWAAYDIDQLYTSGNAISGWAAYDIDQLYTSGNAVSGWASGTFLSNVSPDFTYVSGVANWASGNSVYNWDISDQAGVSGTIADESTVYISGVSGVTTSFQNQVYWSTWGDIDTGSSDSVSLDISSEQDQSRGIAFSSDGLKLSTIGNNGSAPTDAVHQYDLTVAWDLSSASYNGDYLSVTSEEGVPEDLTFSSDGLKMYIVGQSSDKIHQYDLTVAWDVTSASYSSDFLSVSSQENTTRGVTFKTDGTSVYICGGSDNVNQYDLTVAWDVTGGSTYIGAMDTSSEAGTGTSSALEFSPNGMKLYVLDSSSDKIYQYNLTVAWDVTSGSYSGKNLLTQSPISSPTALRFSSDGTKFYVAEMVNDVVDQFSLPSSSLTNKVMTVSAASLSGWAAYDIDQLYTSGNAISGWSKAYTDANGGAAASGWAEYHIFDLYTSGMAISGWAKAYADGISSAAGMTNWNVSDGDGGSESITEGATVEWVGRSGIDTYYNSTNNELEINAGSLSGWANGTIIGTGTTLANDIGESGMAVSGWANGTIIGTGTTLANDIGESGMAVSGWADGTIVNTGVTLANDIGESGMAISGWANGTIIGTGTTLANDIGESGMAISGWANGTIVSTGTTLANDIGESGMAISGWANDTIVSTGTTLVNDIGESGMAISGWARGYTDANGGRTVSPSTTNNGLVTWVTSNQSFAVESGIAYGLPTSDGDNYSTAYPYAQEMTVSGRLVIADDSAQPSSKEALGDWDSSTDISGVLIVQGGATITRNLWASGIQAYGGNIYSRTVGGVGGTVYGDAHCNFISGGGYFKTLKLNDPLNSSIQASGYNTDCVLTWNLDPGGGIHGEHSTLAIKEGVYVNEAIPASDTPTVEDATIALDLSRGSYHNVSLGLDVTSISFSNAQRGQRFILRITQNASAKTVSWTSGPSIKWDRGLVPVMSTGGSRVDVYGFLCTNGAGTSFDGFIIGQDLQ